MISFIGMAERQQHIIYIFINTIIYNDVIHKAEDIFIARVVSLSVCLRNFLPDLTTVVSRWL